MAASKEYLPINMRTKKTYTEVDSVVAFLQDESGTVTLTPKQTELYNRWNFCDNLIRRYGANKGKIFPMLMAKFGYSKETASRDYRNTQMVFNSNPLNAKGYWREVLLEYATDGYKQCLADKDYKTAAMFLSNLIKITGVDRDDAQRIPFEKLQQNIYNVTLNVPAKSGQKNKNLLLNEIHRLNPEQRDIAAELIGESMDDISADDILNSDTPKEDEADEQ